MITNKELNEISLSPTKKDYYQIWNELIDLASKISDRWSPESTNESDPGIVLLKALTAIADKLNYNIDKNTLEAFMPSATQAESMRKLTEMMGYSMKHYISATCDATITYTNSNNNSNFQIYFPKFVNLKDAEEEINYVTIEDFTLTDTEPTRQIPCIEGELVECETNSDNIISMIHLDDNNRYFLPEMTVAENGIFITNVYEVEGTTRESESWIKVDNLNSQLPGAQVFKFGISSERGLPYIQFPDDISQIIGDGIRIRYIRTNGVNGNIKANTLSKLEVPALWSTAEDENIKSLTADDFKITNAAATKNGADPENITSAYNNFKKTIGTFDTLVTCRDYMNKIYQLTESQTDTTPLVSNIIVSDIRDDINNSYCLCSFDEYGIRYFNKAFPTENASDTLESFDLILYPFKTIYGLNTKDEYVSSFKYDASNNAKIEADLALNKTIAHNFKDPAATDIICIKNYLKIKAKITTIKKVTATEEAEILTKIKQAIYSNFNMRKLDFGEEIPYDSICEVIRYADTRIKDITVDEPELITKFMDKSNTEYAVVSSAKNYQLKNNNEVILTGTLEDCKKFKSLATNGQNWTIEQIPESSINFNDLYNKMVLRNVLAGRIAAFQYDESFIPNYREKSYTYGDYEKKYGEESQITKLTSKFNLEIAELTKTVENVSPTIQGYKLDKNEVIQFRTTNFKTTITYPAYVNYYIKLNNSVITPAIPATFNPISTFMKQSSYYGVKSAEQNNYWTDFATANSTILTEFSGKPTEKDIANHILFIKNNTIYSYISNISDIAEASEDAKYYEFKLNGSEPAAKLNTFINSCKIDTTPNSWAIYRSYPFNASNVIGYCVDEGLIRYTKATTFSSDLNTYFVPELHENDDMEAYKYTKDGLGQSLESNEILKNAEYQLKKDEYLLINYTESKTDENSSQETKQVINKYYGDGTIIKANFALIDSDIYASSHTAPKKTGYDFKNDAPNPAGMFTLGTDEQICIREPAAISLFDVKKDGEEKGLSDKPYYIYFIRNDEAEDASIIYFTFDEENGTSYTLKEGEYIFFTDTAKMNLGYYGNGTTIKISAPDGTEKDKLIKKNNSFGKVSYEDIIQNGITAIPWGELYSFNADFNLTFIENQYISLTEGDILSKIIFKDSGKEALDNNWVEVQSAEYRLAETDSNVPLPAINVIGYNWSIRSRLDFNMGPGVGQTLNKYDSITLELEDGNNKLLKVLKAELDDDNIVHPLTLFSNYPCQLAHHIYVPNKLLTAITPFIVKLADVQKTNSNQIKLNNYTDGIAYYTKIDTASASETSIELNINIDDSNKYGLIMFYYKSENTADSATLTATGGNIEQFNVENNNSNSQSYTLKDGIQIIKLDKTVTKLVLNYANATNAIIIFGQLNIVKGINPLLDYRTTSDEQSDGGLTELLEKIAAADKEHKFYYNLPIDNARAIDLNHLVGEKLSSPIAWYDSNNECNKFVISEIDADSLDTGITLTKASRY